MRKASFPALTALTVLWPLTFFPSSAHSTEAVFALQSSAPLTATALDGDNSEVIAAVYGDAGRQGRLAALPRPLSDHDIAAYGIALRLQAEGNWDVADRELAKATDQSLSGSLLAQRYLSPANHPSYGELKAWLARYPDQPEAEAIYRLAHSLKGNDPSLNAPQHGGLADGSAGGDNVADGLTDGENWEDFPPPADQRRLAAPTQAKRAALKQRIRALAKQGDYRNAQALLDGEGGTQAFDDLDRDEMRTVLAANAFAEGRDADAIANAEPAASRNGDKLPTAHWTAAIAEWRMGKPEMARHHFEALANNRALSPWMISAGAFWSARTNLVARRPEVVDHWLEVAAAYPRTFYGLLANHALNQDSWFGWDQPPMTDLDVAAVSRVSGGHRAMIWLQLGDKGRAEEELRLLAGRASPGLALSLLTLANVAELPDLALRLGTQVSARDGRFHDAAAYPAPDWSPHGGWRVDKALVFAFIRQESGFNPNAHNAQGAAGLMQIMPATARANGGTGDLHSLLQPETNLDLGQKLLSRLMTQPGVQGNLFFTAAAYNAGEGNLQRWLQNGKFRDDSLLFVESIPSRQTRSFVQHLMTNYWIYRNRLGENSLSLDAVVAGAWPLYDAGESRLQPQVAKYGKD